MKAGPPREDLEWAESKLRPFESRIIFKHLEVAGDPDPGPAPSEAGLPGRLASALERRGIRRLYKFQYEALEEYRRGNDLVIVSGTGTGKTEAFLLPVLEDIARGRGERPHAVLAYPTKALARDQLYRIKVLAAAAGARVAVLDGDTPSRERSRIYAEPPDILVTNPDTIHYGLAFSDRFRKLLRGVKVAILDEAHVYKGVFGSHVKWVLYRLSRLARETRFIAAGATVGNPERLGSTLFGREVSVVRGPRRRRGAAIHVFVDASQGSRWTLSAYIISALVKLGLKVLGFVDSQQMAELISRIARRHYGVEVGVHRAGLAPEMRRRVEEAFREGDLKAIVATPTMELGVDIGDLDAVVMAHLPRSYSSYVQRAGRAGRRGRPGLVVTLLGDDPIESYFARKPLEYFRQEPEPAYVEPGNREVARVHAAALLLQEGILETGTLPGPLAEAVEWLARKGYAALAEGRVYPAWRRLRDLLEASPGLRSSGPRVRIVDLSSGREVGYRELPQALYDLYTEAIYYHGGRSYVVKRLDLTTLKAEVTPLNAEVGIYTKPMYTIEISDIQAVEERKTGPLRLVYGDVRVVVRVEGYYVKEEASGSVIAEREYDEPLTWEYWTKGVATVFPNPGITSPVALISAYHALEHTLISASRPVVGASDADLGGVSYPSGHIVIYDSAPGGHGASLLVYERFERVMELAYDILAGCTCEDGCPRCVFSPYCGSGNRYLSRKGALKVLGYVLSGRGRAGPPVETPMSGRPLA